MLDPITLVIDATVIERMRLDERSLLLKGRARSEQRVPLTRLLRVDLIGTPVIGMECLLALAERSVPVTFFGRSGKVRAQLFNPQPRATTLSHWLGELFTAHGESECYRFWRDNHLRHVYRSADIHAGTLEEQDNQHGNAFVDALRRCNLLDVYAGIVEKQAGLVEARIGEQLLRFGLPPGGTARAQLCRDLEHLCTRWLFGKTLVWLQRLGSSADSPQFMRYMQSLTSDGLDEWLHRLLSHLLEAAESAGLHQSAA